MTGAPIFSPRVLLGWVGATAAIFAASLYLMGSSDNRSEEIGASVFSRSAIGYAGFAELMQRAGLRVIKGPAAAREAAEPANLLLVTELATSRDTEDKRRALATATNVLFILPKWTGTRSASRAGWIESADLLPASVANWTIFEAGAKGRTARIATPSAWTVNELGPSPHLEKAAQVIAGGDLTPVVATSSGILIGERIERGQRKWIVADPDIFANHGLTKGANAEIAMKIVDALRPEIGGVVFIETLRGSRGLPSNPLPLLFTPPFVFATLNGLAAVALLLWATMPRFGKPEPAATPLAAGKQGLIHNAAHLIAFANHREPVVVGYVRSTIRTVARRLRAPRHLDEAGLVDWLDRVGRARGSATDLRAIVRRVQGLTGGLRADMATLVSIARDTYRWKLEMLGGS